MRDFLKRAFKKLNKLNSEQIEQLFLRAAEEMDRLETVLDSLSEGILVCDQSHRIVMANKFARRFLPPPDADGIIGQGPIWTVVQNENVAKFLEDIILSGDHAEDREFNVELKGLSLVISLSVLPMVKEHHVTGSLIHMEDITEKKSKDARLRRAENLASLTTLAAGVAHEIKNPLGSISIHIQLMQKAMEKNTENFYAAHPNGKDGDLNPIQYMEMLTKYISVVNEEVDRLNHIVVDFLFAVRPMNMDLREGNINELISELVDFVSYELEDAHITTVLDLDKSIPLIRFDERYLKQALLNLVKNAMAAMEGGGALTIKTCQKEMDVLISVSDTGTGISEENLPKIFEPYFTTKESGSGLGLTLIFKIIKEHLGEISVKSREGEGACFTISLPVPQKERRLLTSGNETNGGSNDL
jgi:PAS domain S-box-containing protein